MKIKSFLLILVLQIIVFPQQYLDRVVAVVEREIILQSELDFRAEQEAKQKNISPQTPGLKMSILNSMIDEKLLFAQAEFDSVIVSEQEINAQVEYQINYLTELVGSRENLEKTYGMSIDRIRGELRDGARKNLMIQRLIDTKFGRIEASRREIEMFFEKYKDSLGTFEAKVTLSHILKIPNTSEAMARKSYDFALSLLDSLKNGADFASLAMKYSDDSASGKFGGDLGIRKRGDFVPEFEAAAFSLKDGEISGIVKSQFGYHIIQMVERRGGSINVRHILVGIKPDPNSDNEIISLLTDIRDSITRFGQDFSVMAKKYSDDERTKNLGGLLGSFYTSGLTPELKTALEDLKNKGDITFVKPLPIPGVGTGYHIVRLDERIPRHKPDLDIDYDEFKKLASEEKKANLVNEMLENAKKIFFWEIKHYNL
ncbi:MAG: peptidylprolyl isomerase [Ignavibacteriaceae bacterium]|nr:peptidylprolyl isomerase [Ignavibacteriaceae bacterium]